MYWDICRDRYYLGRKYHWSEYDISRMIELNRLYAELAVEEIEIHHYGKDYVHDCPAFSEHRKLWPTRDVYSRYGCTGCFYFVEIGLRHVRCKWTSAHSVPNPYAGTER